MIKRIENTKNGYELDETSTNEDLKELLKTYNSGKDVNCIIMNHNTRKYFRVGIFSNDIITINNKVPNFQLYINGVYQFSVREQVLPTLFLFVNFVIFDDIL